MAEESTPRFTAEASPYSRHLPALDGVRGLAILMVMGSHFFPGSPHNFTERFLRGVLSFGATGVDLFFVLSGFLITGILYDSLGDPHFFRKFYARRALRILPLYYGVLAIYAVIGLVEHRSSQGELFSFALYMQNTGVIAPPIFLYDGPLHLPLGHFWSLAIEEQFYLVWPLLVFLVRRRRPLLLLCSAFMILCPVLRFLAWQHGMLPVSVHSNTLCRADTLLIGGALALLLRGGLHDRVLCLAPWLSPAVFLLPVLTGLSLLPEAFLKAPLSLGAAAVSYSLLAIGYFGLISLALSRSTARAFFSMKPLRVLGRYSYGLYVLHLILLGYVEEKVHVSLSQLHVNRGIQLLIIGVTCFAVSFAAAVLSYQLYERHFLRLKRFFDYRGHGSAASRESSVSTPASHSANPSTLRSTEISQDVPRGV